MAIQIGPLDKKKLIQEQLPLQTPNPRLGVGNKLVASFKSNKFFTIGETLERREALEEAGRKSRPLNQAQIDERKDELTLGGMLTVKPGETEEQIRLKQQWFLKNKELEFVLANSPGGVFPEILSFGAGMLGSMAHHIDFMMNFIPLELLTARGIAQTAGKGAIKKGLSKQFDGTPRNISKFMGQADEFILKKAPLYKTGVSPAWV